MHSLTPSILHVFTAFLTFTLSAHTLFIIHPKLVLSACHKCSWSLSILPSFLHILPNDLSYPHSLLRLSHHESIFSASSILPLQSFPPPFQPFALLSPRSFSDSLPLYLYVSSCHMYTGVITTNRYIFIIYSYLLPTMNLSLKPTHSAIYLADIIIST